MLNSCHKPSKSPCPPHLHCAERHFVVFVRIVLHGLENFGASKYLFQVLGLHILGASAKVEMARHADTSKRKRYGGGVGGLDGCFGVDICVYKYNYIYIYICI